MKFSTSSALLISFLLLASMMVEPVQSTEIRIRENKNKQYDLPVRRTLHGGGPKGKGKGGSPKGKGGKGGTCSNKNAESCVSDPNLPPTACKDSPNSDIDDTGACVGLDFIDGGGTNVGVCENMDFVTVDKYSCVDQGACSNAAFAEICQSSCQGFKTCINANSLGDPDHILTIGPGSCRSGKYACWNLQNVEKIGSGSCIYEAACSGMNGSSEEDRTTVGENSCVGEDSCRRFLGKSIGDNACVGNGICKDCAAGTVVGANECNIEIAAAPCPC